MYILYIHSYSVLYDVEIWIECLLFSWFCVHKLKHLCDMRICAQCSHFHIKQFNCIFLSYSISSHLPSLLEILWNWKRWCQANSHNKWKLCIILEICPMCMSHHQHIHMHTHLLELINLYVFMLTCTYTLQFYFCDWNVLLHFSIFFDYLCSHAHICFQSKIELLEIKPRLHLNGI